MTPHPKFPRFFALFKAQPALLGMYQAEVFRQTLPRYLSRPYRFTGAGSVLCGGRWGAQKLMPDVYASVDLQTLAAEAYYKARLYGWTPSEFQPQLVVRMGWELQAVADLTAPGVLKKLRVSKRELLGCDWAAEQSAGREPLTQALARAVFENLGEGLVVPSARHQGGVNIVYFPTHRRPGTLIDTLDEAQIPFMHGFA